jgi:hypothetical protein
VKEPFGLLLHYSRFSVSLRRQCVHGIFLEKKERNSMKIKVIFIVALAVCLSSSLAMAATIQGTGDAAGTDLWTIINTMAGTGYNSTTLNALNAIQHYCGGII